MRDDFSLKHIDVTNTFSTAHPSEHYVSPSLQVVKLRNLDLESCMSAYRGTEFGHMIDKSMLCSGTHAGGFDTCAVSY